MIGEYQCCYTCHYRSCHTGSAGIAIFVATGNSRIDLYTWCEEVYILLAVVGEAGYFTGLTISACTNGDVVISSWRMICIIRIREVVYDIVVVAIVTCSM